MLNNKQCLLQEPLSAIESTHLETKILQFKQAMDKYSSNIYYNKFGLLVSSIVVTFQSLTVINFINTDNSPVNYMVLIILFFCSYIISDLVSGVVHLIADNNTNYTSIVGPFVAAFHLHHKQPSYKTKHPLRVYFDESGAKLWLPFYLLAVIILQQLNFLSFNQNFCLVMIGILSSVAEVSHYWCHNATAKNRIIKKLQKYRILLDPSHHKYHHKNDNVHYAFLNGVTDPLLNIIARFVFKGYKNYADLHVKAYNGLQTTNR